MQVHSKGVSLAICSPGRPLTSVNEYSKYKSALPTPVNSSTMGLDPP